MPAEITADVPIEARSRTFTPDQARQVLNLLQGKAEGQEAPARNVKFGAFDTAGAARSAGVTLNRLLVGLGADHKYAVTTQQRNGKYEGVVLNKPAKERPAKKTPAKTGAKKS